MNSYLLVCVLFIGVSADEEYTDKYDNIDLEEILHSDRLMLNYLNCLLDKGPCTPDGRELKNVLPDALETACSKCNDKQKSATKKVVHYLIGNKREWWDLLEKKYDPDRKYVEKYREQLEKEGIVL